MPKVVVLTGIVLAISRIAGETAPLIMTILGTSLFFTGFTGPIDALPLRIWRLASQPYESAHSQGWGAGFSAHSDCPNPKHSLRFWFRGKQVSISRKQLFEFYIYYIIYLDNI